MVKNAAQDLSRSIESVAKYIDEIIVVDTGSTDATVDVAKKFGARIFHELWQEDFSAPRNIALRAAKGDWIVFLDADEFFVNDTAKNFQYAIKRAASQGITGLYVNFVNVDADNDNKIISATHLLRVFENAPSVRYVGKIHETLYRDGKILDNVTMPPADMLTVWHTGYSKSIVRAKLERNLIPLLEELNTSDEPERTYSYLTDCYYGLEDWTNAEKFARLYIEHFADSVLTRPYRVLIDCLQKSARLDDYIAACKLAVEHHPKVPEFSAKLAEGFAVKGDYRAAVDEMRLAFDKAANFGEEYDASSFNEDIQQIARKLIDTWQKKISPNVSDLTNELIQLVETGREREKILRTAEKIFELKPAEPEPLERVASIYVDYRMIDAAEEVVAYLEKNFAPSMYRLLLRARIHFLQTNCLATIETAERALTLEGGELVTRMMIHNILGQAYRFVGNASKAVEHYKFNATLNLDALKNSPQLAQAQQIQRDEYDNWLFNLHAINVTREEIFSATLGFNKLLAHIPRFKHDRKLHARHKKIRVGYISPDIRFHVVAFFSSHFFMNYDKTRFEVVIYANNAEDNNTAKFKANVDAFRNISGVDAKTVAAQILRDEIDILVDLAGHTANNSLEVMTYKPAPIQISGVGYFDSTGLDTIDYFLADKFTDPEGLNEKFFTEKILRLQHSHFCYVWHDFPHMTTPAPCVKNNFVTFASFNDFAKVTDEMLGLWKKILDGVPNSRLYLKGRAFRANCDAFAREKILSAGIDLSRVDCEPDEIDYVKCYERADIALDTFPYPGGGTTCDALYMGVPVITLVGERHNSRFGYSLLMNVGLEELCALDAEDYVRKAIELANDSERLREYHLTIRRKMELSPVMDDTIYMGEVEEAYEKIFGAWINRKPLPDFPQEEPPLTEELAEIYSKRAISYLPLEVKAGESKFNRVDYKRTFYFAEKAAQFPAKRDFKILVALADRSFYLNDNSGSYEFMREAVDYIYSHGAENFSQYVIAESHSKLARYALSNGLYNEAADNYARAFDLTEKPARRLEIYDSLLLSLHFFDFTSEELAAPHFDCQNFFADIEPFTTYHAPHERIRVGYISGDFRKHAVFSVVFGFMSCHDRSKFEIICYSKNKINDEFTDFYRRGIEHFIDVSNLSAEELAKKIHDDEIDIAFDLAGHTGYNGLPALAYRPALVQISGIGYMSTTGLKAIDYFITDEVLDPPNQNREQFFSEKFLYMPAQLSYARREDLPTSNGAPCVKNGYVTFGTICRYMKITDAMLAVWSEILRRVPTAKLIMRAQEFISNRTVNELYRRMKDLGCDMERVIFRPAIHDYFGAISQIDIMLDSYPYPGGTTDLDALYMGVPVVSLYGERHSTRFGFSVLASVGLSELAVDNVAAYIDTAVALANDSETLDVLHKNLRAMFLNSDALNPMTYCRLLEKKFIELLEAAHEDNH